MRPHQLTVTAFGAFPGTVQVDVDALAGAGLFLLHGETGAGKTTLLDGIGFALYGTVPGERNRAKRLRSDHAAAGVRTTVTLEFSVGARRLRITRSPEQGRPKLRGAGTTTEPARVLLEERGSDEWTTVSTRVAEADAEIARLIGMSADQFFQVILLPQGEFARFLRADAEERGRLLERLFGTDRFRDVEKWLAERRKATAKAVEDLERDAAVLVARIAQAGAVESPQSPDLAWATGLVDAARAAAEDADRSALRRRAALDQAHARLDSDRLLADRFRRRDAAVAERERLGQDSAGIAALQAELDGAGRAAEALPAIELADQAGQKAAEADGAARVASAAAVDAGAPADSDAEQMRALAATQRTRLGALEELRPVLARAEQEQNAATADRAQAARLDGRRAALRAELAGMPELRAAATARRNDALAAGRALGELRIQLETAREAHRIAATTVELRARHDQLHEEHQRAREAALELKERAQDVREARFEGMVAELAGKLADGDECPVCGSVEHPNPYLSTAPTVDKSDQDAAERRADDAATLVGRLGEELSAARGDLSAARARLVELGHPDASADAVGRVVRELERSAADLAARAASLQAVEDELDALRLRESQAGVELAEISARAESLLQSAALADGRAAQLSAQVSAGLGRSPTLAEAVSTAQRLAQACETAATAVAEAARRRGDHDDRKTAATAAVRRAGFEHVEAARAAVRDPRWRAQAAERIEEHRRAGERISGVLADPALELAEVARPDVAGSEAAFAQATSAHQDARAQFARLADRADEVAELVAPLAAVLDRLEPARSRAATVKGLADLAGGSGSNTLKMTLSSFVLAARLEEVAAVASQRLARMTGGRYALVHTDATRGAGRSGLGLLVRDAWTGRDRDTATLSGGETFMASLALALGLADVVTAEAGGGRLDALFVDEGFGSLDEETLDEVMDVLDGLRAGGRIVGVVSHVAEMRARIPAQLRVRKQRTGSTVELVGA